MRCEQRAVSRKGEGEEHFLILSRSADIHCTVQHEYSHTFDDKYCYVELIECGK